MARLGILGGTFDPPHLGHLILADEAFHQLKLDKLFWVLTPDPPHKRKLPLTPIQIRLNMLLAAIAGNPYFEFSPIDVNRPGPHYAVDTIKILTGQQPDDNWIYLMGEDSLRDLPAWRSPLILVSDVTAIGVMPRLGSNYDLKFLDQKIPGLSAKITYLDSPFINISASSIRKRIALGLPYRYFVPLDVYNIIQAEGLYRVN